ncbi:MAG: hypothetical protein HYX74_10775 [Acidobacteria bacterium]|nr:hypothetical protein [Acidobacteriota bacterium]
MLELILTRAEDHPLVAAACPYDETPEQLAELKASFPTPRDAVAYIMETFPIVKRKDEEKRGEYWTKRSARHLSSVGIQERCSFRAAHGYFQVSAGTGGWPRG